MELSNLLPERLRNTQLGVASAIVVAMILTSASIFATGPDSAPAVTPEKAWPVSIVHAELGQIAPGFSAFGRVESQRIAQLRTDLMARIEQVLVREGEWKQGRRWYASTDVRLSWRSPSAAQNCSTARPSSRPPAPVCVPRKQAPPTTPLVMNWPTRNSNGTRISCRNG